MRNVAVTGQERNKTTVLAGDEKEIIRGLIYLGEGRSIWRPKANNPRAQSLSQWTMTVRGIISPTFFPGRMLGSHKTKKIR